MYSCSHHPEDGQMGGRNMFVFSVLYGYTHKSEYICWSFNNFMHFLYMLAPSIGFPESDRS